METIRVLFDTDLGDDVDDAAALILALRCPQFEITGVTTVFKDTVKRAQLVRDLLSRAGRPEIPVYAGYGKAFVEQRFDETEAPIQYGLLEGAESHTEEKGQCAVDFILDTLKKQPDTVILAMGSMTNLAMACMKDPKTMEQAKIVAMGGAFLSSYPEWNIICDPEAAAVVLRTCKNLICMGLDVTKYLGIDETRLEQWKTSGDPLLEYFLKGVAMFQKATGFPVTFHDVLLVAYLLDPQVVTLKKGSFAVELAGRLTRGTMVDQSNYYEIDPKPEEGLLFATKVDTERFFRILDQYFVSTAV
ncbi:nucleoside hydrolase [Lachnospiraceae bacterium HCP1S3_A8]